MEKNQHILDNALKQLRSFSPEDAVWENVKSELIVDPLHDSLSKLSTFDPPESVWKTVSQELSKKEKISQLKQFTPDENIWQGIEAELSNRPSHNPLTPLSACQSEAADREGRTSQRTRSDRFPFIDSRNEVKDVWGQRGRAGKFRKNRLYLLTLISTAAAILFLGYFVATSIINKKDLNYTEELIELRSTNDWEDEDSEISTVLNELCKSNPMACSSPGFKEKEKELDYLNEQKQEVLKRITAWDENEDLQLILTKIELEKNEIIKQMISTII